MLIPSKCPDFTPMQLVLNPIVQQQANTHALPKTPNQALLVAKSTTKLQRYPKAEERSVLQHCTSPYCASRLQAKHLQSVRYIKVTKCCVDAMLRTANRKAKRTGGQGLDYWGGLQRQSVTKAAHRLNRAITCASNRSVAMAVAMVS